jgi:serine/threonine protein kinase
MAKVLMEGSLGLCSMFGLSEDNTSGEVFVVMEARRGDLQNLIDFRMRYLKSQMRSMKKNGAEMMMMPFSYGSTLSMMHQIAYGMETPHGSGLMMHKDLKASNIFVTRIDKTGNSDYKFVDSGNVKLKKDLTYHSFWVSVQDYWNSGGIVNTGLWRPPNYTFNP